MKVYKLRFGEEYEWLLPVQDRDFERLRFDGRPRASSWVPVEMKRLSVSERGRRLTAGDLYACSGGETLVFGDGARQSLGPELERYGEVLPLSCEGRPFWTLNVTSFVDALDERASQVVRASDTGGILMIRRYAFKAASLGRAGLFNLPQTPRGPIYATDSFADKLNERKLVGLELVQVWAPD
ncbi:MAG: imm11 family protein [Polyangiaceae bacterium]